LDDALEHIVYEIWKYKQSVAQYESICRVCGDAALEFRVLHHRVLLEFFYGPPKHKNNIVAWEYVAGWETSHGRTNITWIDCYLSRCHTMLAHISTERTRIARSGRKPWNEEFDTVEPHLNDTIKEFLNSLSANHKEICRTWVSRWNSQSYGGSQFLKELADALRPSA